MEEARQPPFVKVLHKQTPVDDSRKERSKDPVNQSQLVELNSYRFDDESDIGVERRDLAPDGLVFGRNEIVHRIQPEESDMSGVRIAIYIGKMRDDDLYTAILPDDPV